MSTEKRWVISGIDSDELCYWSNDDGWGDVAEATRFSDQEREVLNLPLGDKVKWLRLEED